MLTVDKAVNQINLNPSILKILKKHMQLIENKVSKKTEFFIRQNTL